jgi:uncharacterized membrane protein (UPF0127 family)
VKLVHGQTKQTLVPHLEVADSLWRQARGLLGRDSLADGTGLWIHGRSSIHTLFMKFAIDLIFLDRELVVTKTVANVKPFRVIWRGWRSASVVEVPEGFLAKHPLRVGDKLHVDN